MYITVEEVKARVTTQLADSVLEDMIKGAVSLIHVYLGAVPANPMTEKVSIQVLGKLTFRAEELIGIQNRKIGQSVDMTAIEVNGRMITGLPPGLYDVTYTIEQFEDLMTVIRGICLDLAMDRVIEANMKMSGTDFAKEKIGDYEYVKGDQQDLESKQKSILHRLRRFKGLGGAVVI